MLKELFLSAIILLAIVQISKGASSNDPLAAEIQRWNQFIKNHPADSDDWKQLRDICEPVLAKAQNAFNHGQTLYALHLLGLVRPMLDAQKYVEGLPAKSREQQSALEAEWRKVGPSLNERPNLAATSAAVRAIGQAALSQIKPYYEASLEYGRNTVADAGFYYLGSARAELDFARFCSALPVSTPSSGFPIPNIEAVMDDVEDQLLASYKPPASTDHHVDFIRTSAMLKQARELHEGGMDTGALYVALEARLRLAKILPNKSTLASDVIAKRASKITERLNREKIDHTIARLFLETAVPEGGETGRSVFDDIMPRYFTALQASKPRPKGPAAVSTVTLVRWPYT